jgi:hypothetical protein
LLGERLCEPRCDEKFQADTSYFNGFCLTKLLRVIDPRSVESEKIPYR